MIIIADGTLVADDTIEGLTAGEGGRVRLVVTSRDGDEIDVDAVVERLGELATVRRAQLGDSDEHGSLALTVFPEPEADARREIFDSIVASDLVLLEMQREGISLEKTFRRLTATTGGHHA